MNQHHYGITLNGMHSYRDLHLLIPEGGRNIYPPEPKTVRETVPYFSGSYDYSNLPGYLSYLDRTLEYAFDFSYRYVQDMEQRKSEIIDWLTSFHSAELRDDASPGWHYRVGQPTILTADDGGICTVTATFTAYPFRISDRLRRISLGANTPAKIYNPGQPVIPEATASKACMISNGTHSASLPAGETVRLPFPLFRGANSITATKTVVLTWREERI